MTKTQEKFVDAVWAFYKRNGRHDLPWRKTKNPYRILVSEVMLQQTQVERVIPKYKAFLKTFPTIQSLAQAPLREVLILWQGLGYNRRAQMLHDCAKEVIKTHTGKLPKIYDELCTLPGIGPYTAGAVVAFAYNQPISIIETNIRTVFHHHFFKDQMNVTDKETFRLIQKFSNVENPREWHWALMDYGAFLKKEYGSINNKSKHYTKQSKFKGSDREIRGAIMRVFSESKHSHTITQLQKELGGFDSKRINTQLKKLLEEKLIQCVKEKYQLAT